MLEILCPLLLTTGCDCGATQLTAASSYTPEFALNVMGDVVNSVLNPWIDSSKCGGPVDATSRRLPIIDMGHTLGLSRSMFGCDIWEQQVCVKDVNAITVLGCI